MVFTQYFTSPVHAPEGMRARRESAVVCAALSSTIHCIFLEHLLAHDVLLMFTGAVGTLVFS